jgi:hypothetical protein
LQVDCPGIYHKFGGCGFRTDHLVHVYSSPDLVRWTLVGDALPISRRPDGIYFRPKVVHCPLTGKFVLWINYLPPASSPLTAYPRATYLVSIPPCSAPTIPNEMSDFPLQVAQSDTPEGPFTVVSPCIVVPHHSSYMLYIGHSSSFRSKYRRRRLLALRGH